MNPSLVFESSKAGELTCSFQGKYLHSKYNPTNEGEKFAAGIKADFSPLCVFILEPALSYCAPFLKKRFPKARQEISISSPRELKRSSLNETDF